MPGPAPILPVAFEPVGVEIVRALVREAAERAIVERALHDVRVGAVEIEVEHALRPEGQRDGGAGLCVSGVVRQVVGLGEAFIGFARPEARRDVHLRGRHVAPERLTGAPEALVAKLESEVRHRRRHVHRADGVPDHAGLLADGLVRLIVLVCLRPERRRVLATRQRFLREIVRLVAALVDEIGREIEAPAIARQPVELDERKLDLLMAGITALLTRGPTEGRGDVIDVALHRVEEFAFSGRAKIGDRPFEQMSGVVELVVVAQVGPAVLRLPARCTSSCR